MTKKNSKPSFNKAQQKAVNHKNGPMMVLAGPGSGKTLVITHRIKTLIDKYQISPSNILVITFTKAAAREMKERFEKLMDGKYVPVHFGTFHAIFFTILKHAYRYDSSNIIREDEKKKILQNIIEQLNLDIEDVNSFIEDIESEISLVKGERMSLEHYYPMNCAKDIFENIYNNYQRIMEQKRRIDFDDMMVLCYELLSKRPDILEQWQQQFQYILIDEFQDINKVQYDMIQMLASPRNNLFIVGDDDQSIYGFRGAKPEIMLQFEEIYPDAEKVLLDVNYRSTECIVETASVVIKRNKKRFPKQIRTNNERGKEVEIREFPDVKHENQKVIEIVEQYHKNGMPYRNMAVLFRTNTQPRSLIGTFLEYNIPIYIKEQVPNIYHHWIAQNIIAYIKLALGQRERSLFLQVANRPNRYINRQIFDTPEISFSRLYSFFEEKPWMQKRLEKWEYDLTMLKKMSPYAAINFIRKGIGYEEYLVQYAEYRRMKVEELYEILDELMDMAKPFRTYEDWFWHMKQYEKQLEKQQKGKEDREEDAVSFVTMHGSKGLEYEVVFIVDVNEGIIPHPKAVLEADVEEERRMFYVAMTRAKKELYIYFARNRWNKELTMSRFVAELLEEQKE